MKNIAANRLFVVFTAVLVILISSSVSAADNFNIDFGGDSPSDVFGGSGGQPGYWNAIGIPGPAGEFLSDLNDELSTVKIFSTGFQAGGGTIGATDAEKIHDGGINQTNSNATPWTLTISGIANGDYRVTLYGPRDTNANETGDYYVEDPLLIFDTLTASSSSSHVVSITDGTINIARDPSYAEATGVSRYVVSGLQITAVPEPASLLVFSLGGLLLIHRRRQVI